MAAAAANLGCSHDLVCSSEFDSSCFLSSDLSFLSFPFLSFDFLSFPFLYFCLTLERSLLRYCQRSVFTLGLGL